MECAGTRWLGEWVNFLYLKGPGGGDSLVTKSCPTLVTPWTPLKMGFPRQGYWSELPFPSPGNLCNPGIKPESPEWQADSLQTKPSGKPLKGPRSSITIDALNECTKACTKIVFTHKKEGIKWNWSQEELGPKPIFSFPWERYGWEHELRERAPSSIPSWDALLLFSLARSLVTSVFGNIIYLSGLRSRDYMLQALNHRLLHIASTL